MSVFSKIKNVLFTEEDETEEIPVLTSYDKKEEVKKEVHEEEVPRFRNINYDDFKIDSEEIKEEIEKETKPKVEERSPFQQFDEEEFERIAAINKSKLIERDRRAREEKERASQKYSSIGKREEKNEIKEEVHKFKPTPVISPVYGILDKNYTKEDILPRASSEGTLPKVIDVDKVREKAFGTLEEMEQDMTDNLSDIKITTFEEQDIEDDNVVVMSNGDVDKLENINEEKELELPKIEANDEEKELIDDIKSEDIKEELENTEEIEKDLFNLIDSMYQSEEGDK